MNFDDFQTNALKTEAKISAVVFNETNLLDAMTLAIGVGTFLDAIKKNVFYGKTMNNAELRHVLRQIITLAKDLEHNIGSRDTAMIDVNPRLFHGVIGKFTEATELVEALRKSMNEGDEIDKVNIAEEIGDDQWYTAILVDELKVPMSTIQHTVINKLKARYPEKFTTSAAIHRDLEGERKVLESGINEAHVE